MKEEQRVSNHPDFKRKISNYDDELNKVRDAVQLPFRVATHIHTYQYFFNGVNHSH